MVRWFRLLVIALLLPAYGLAAIGTPAAPEHDAAVHASANGQTDVSALIAELGDTTDDACDHCLPHVAILPVSLPPAVAPSLGPSPAVDAPLARLLRPPRP